LQALVNFLPGLRRWLNITPMTMSDLLAILSGAGIPFLLNEAAKPAKAGIGDPIQWT